VIKD